MKPSLLHGPHKNSDICHNMVWLPLPLVLSWHCNLTSSNISCDSSCYYQWNSKFWLHLMLALTILRSLRWTWTPSFGCPPSRVIIPRFTKVDFLRCLYIIVLHWPIVWYGQQFGDAHTLASLLPPTPTALPEYFFNHPEKLVLVSYPPSRRRISTGIYFQIDDLGRSIFISGFLPGGMRWIVWNVSAFGLWLAHKKGRVAFGLFWLEFPFYNGASSFAIMLHIVVHVTAAASLKIWFNIVNTSISLFNS